MSSGRDFFLSQKAQKTFQSTKYRTLFLLSCLWREGKAPPRTNRQDRQDREERQSMSEFEIRYVGGHVEVYSRGGAFLFSADTVREAMEELES